jgi:hypothetical protein
MRRLIAARIGVKVTGVHDLNERSSGRRFKLHRCLLGLQLADRLTSGDGVANLRGPVANLSYFGVVAESRHLYWYAHRAPSSFPASFMPATLGSAAVQLRP